MTPFQRVAAMNTAFGNPKGDFKNIDATRLRKQCVNIGHEFLELLTALGAGANQIRNIKEAMNEVTFEGDIDVVETRDALCDIQVFSNGAQHFMGVDGDADMHAVVDGVMTRFVKDDEDLQQTLKMHAAKGVTEVYFEGIFPTMVMKSAFDQPDAPKGKFLKSASYTNTVFPEVI